MSESVLDNDLVEDRLRTLLCLLEGSNGGGGGGGGVVRPNGPDLVAGTPGDTLQYLSQLETVARKLKDQIMRQKQVG